MILTPIHLFAVHIDGCDAKEASIFGRGTYSTPAILGTVEFVGCDPSLVVLYALPDQGAQILVNRVAGSVFSIESLFKVLSGGPAILVKTNGWLEKMNLSAHSSSTSAKNSRAQLTSFSWVGCILT